MSENTGGGEAGCGAVGAAVAVGEGVTGFEVVGAVGLVAFGVAVGVLAFGGVAGVVGGAAAGGGVVGFAGVAGVDEGGVRRSVGRLGRGGGGGEITFTPFDGGGGGGAVDVA